MHGASSNAFNSSHSPPHLRLTDLPLELLTQIAVYCGASPDEDLRLEVYDLPQEIHARDPEGFRSDIYAVPRPSIRPLSQTCRMLRAAALPVLYRSVDCMTSAAWRDFVTNLRLDEGVALYVRRFQSAMMPDGGGRLSKVWKRTRTLTDEDEDETIAADKKPPMVFRFAPLAAMQHLVRLELVGFVAHPTFTALCSVPDALPHLEKFALVFDYLATLTASQTATVARLLARPSLRTAYIADAVFAGRIEDLLGPHALHTLAPLTRTRPYSRPMCGLLGTRHTSTTLLYGCCFADSPIGGSWTSWGRARWGTWSHGYIDLRVRWRPGAVRSPILDSADPTYESGLPGGAVLFDAPATKTMASKPWPWPHPARSDAFLDAAWQGHSDRAARMRGPWGVFDSVVPRAAGAALGILRRTLRGDVEAMCEALMRVLEGELPDGMSSLYLGLDGTWGVGVVEGWE